MTDWSGGSDPVEQMNAENDVLMPGRPNQVQAIVQAVKDGKISQQQLDANVARTLEIVCKSPAFKNYPFSNHPDLKAHARVAREVAAEGMVLLKNEKNTLPLKSNRSIALFGNASYDLIAGGTGSGDVNKAYIVSLDQGLANSGVAIDAGLKKLYADYLKEKKSARSGRGGGFGRSASVAEMSVDDAAVKALALSADSAIFTLGRSSGEFSDRKLTNDYLLSDVELAPDELHRPGVSRGREENLLLS